VRHSLAQHGVIHRGRGFGRYPGQNTSPTPEEDDCPRYTRARYEYGRSRVLASTWCVRGGCALACRRRRDDILPPRDSQPVSHGAGLGPPTPRVTLATMDRAKSGQPCSRGVQRSTSATGPYIRTLLDGCLRALGGDFPGCPLARVAWYHTIFTGLHQACDRVTNRWAAHAQVERRPCAALQSRRRSCVEVEG